ncbi:murein hydrolase activator EnvC family protein, partial [Patescibacteria group bacterium]
GMAQDSAVEDFEAESIETTTDEESSNSDTELVEVAEEDIPTEEELILERQQQEFLLRLKQELNLSKADFRQIEKNVNDTQERLKIVKEEKLTLEEQLNNIDGHITNTAHKLLDIVQQIVIKENEISLVTDQISSKETAVEYQKELLRDYIKAIYVEENTYFSLDENGDVNPFKLLLAEDSVSTNLKQLQYFDLLNDAGQQIIDRLGFLQHELEIQRNTLKDNKENLEILEDQIQGEQMQLKYQKIGKENLLKLTKGQEEIYTQLLEQTITEREEVLDAIRNFSSAVEFIEWKIIEDGADFNPEDYYSLLDYKTQAVYRFRFSEGNDGDVNFIWPLEPTNGLSAYFRDPSYVSVFGVRHNAVDMPRNQRTPIRAAEDGVVYIAKDNGYGYSYIIVAHHGGFLTVYGHINEIMVKEGQTIPQGYVIGLSGGMPGTEGAGYMTTGPHLHFEVLLNGLYVDPLNYLPLDIFSEEEILELPNKYYANWEEDINAPEEEVEVVEKVTRIIEADAVEDFEQVTR